MENLFDCPDCENLIHETCYLDEEGVCMNCFDKVDCQYESDVDTDGFYITG